PLPRPPAWRPRWEPRRQAVKVATGLRAPSAIRARPRAVTVVLPPAPRVGPPRVEPEPWARSVELVAPAERAGPAVLVERVVRVVRVAPVRARLVAAPRVVRVAWLTAVRAARWPRVLVVTVARPTPAAPRVVMVARVPVVTAATPTAASRSPRQSP